MSGQSSSTTLLFSPFIALYLRDSPEALALCFSPPTASRPRCVSFFLVQAYTNRWVSTSIPSPCSLPKPSRHEHQALPTAAEQLCKIIWECAECFDTANLVLHIYLHTLQLRRLVTFFEPLLIPY
ncbi:hypothetical protein C8J57DRAFT_1529190 [Mycena rebaudengoi]|nr:hypothetical protein C8J57DRAFT_1529190 [Mycena rebaudengoi]